MGYIKSMLMTAAAAMCFTLTTAAAQDVFLAMRAGDSVGITADENGYYEYTDMMDSNGVAVEPILTSDGNTYLPLRFICEKAGIADGNSIEGDLPDGYFRFRSVGEDGVPEIEIRVNGESYRHNIGEEFTYSSSEGDREVAIYNISGTLYAPMRYIAETAGASAYWCAAESRIILLGKGLEYGDYLGSDNTLNAAKTMHLSFEPFMNNMTGSALYLKTDGVEVYDLASELGGSAVSCITRNGGRLYYVDDDSKVKIKSQDADDISELRFYDADGADVGDVYVSTAIALQNRIFGIRVDSPGEEDGRLFSAALDGSDFKYLTEYKIYDLAVNKDYLDYYLFYAEAENRNTLHMIRVTTMDDYTIEIKNHYEQRNLLSNVRQFVVNRDNLYYIDDDGALHMVDTGRVLEEIEIVWLEDDAVKTVSYADNGDSLDDIDAMNFDYVNNVLYVVKGNRIYYYTERSGRVRLLYEADGDITDFSIFRNRAYQVMIAGKVNGEVFKLLTDYSAGSVSIE